MTRPVGLATRLADPLARTDAARSHLLADLAHEIRTPLATRSRPAVAAHGSVEGIDFDEGLVEYLRGV